VGEVPDRRTNRRPRGIDAGHENQHHRAEDVFERQVLAVEFRVQEIRREVIGGAVHVLFDLGDEVLLDRLELDDALFFR